MVLTVLLLHAKLAAVGLKCWSRNRLFLKDKGETVIIKAVNDETNILYPDENAPKFYPSAASDGEYTRYTGTYVSSNATIAPFTLVLTCSLFKG